jgi:hypothetical protein
MFVLVLPNQMPIPAYHLMPNTIHTTRAAQWLHCHQMSRGIAKTPRTVNIDGLTVEVSAS